MASAQAAAATAASDVVLEPEVYALLAAAGFAVPAHRFVRSSADVDASLCAALPSAEAVVKVVSPQVLHKTELGGVRFCRNAPLDVRDAVAGVLEAVRGAAPRAEVRGALVVERVRHQGGFGRELLIGFRHDPAFGPVVVAGVGGLDTEYLLASLKPERAKVVLAAEGLTRDVALTALRGTAVGAVLGGTLRSSRGEPAMALDRVADLLLALATLARRHAGFDAAADVALGELELNPVVLAEDGRLVALDGLARRRSPSALAAPRRIESLRHLLTPTSVLVVGASAEGTNVGRVILRNLASGSGIPRDRIWVLHPRAEAIEGCRAFPSADGLPEPADMAVVAAPAEKGAAQVVSELVEKRRARSVTLISGGLGETEQGSGSEARLREALDAAHREADGGVPVNGGNCLGILSVPGRYNSFFIPPHKLPFHDAPGQNVAAISQSGAYLATLISNLDRMVSPRYAISFGNQIDVTVSDYLEYLDRDEAVRVFAVYLEGFRPGDGARFLEVTRRLSGSGRPVLLYKAGRTPEGSAAVRSHTAAAVGDYEVCRELSRAAGAIECATLNMFEDYLLTFSFLEGREAPGRRVAVVSNAGFECTAAADRLYGLQLAELAPATRVRVKAMLPAGVVDVHNPVDTTPLTPTERYVGCVEALALDPSVDGVVVAGVPATPYLEDLAAGSGHSEDIESPMSLPSQLIRVFRQTRKPLVFSVDAGPLYDPCVRMMMRAGLPCFRKVDRATRALAAFLQGSHAVSRLRSPQPCFAGDPAQYTNSRMS